MRTKPPATLFGRRLREARERAELPQDLLGVRIGLDEGSASTRISRYETGVHEPPFDIAARLAEVLHIPTAYLYCSDDELAGILLAWPALPKSVKQRVKALIEAPVEKIGKTRA